VAIWLVEAYLGGASIHGRDGGGCGVALGSRNRMQRRNSGASRRSGGAGGVEGPRHTDNAYSAERVRILHAGDPPFVVEMCALEGASDNKANTQNPQAIF
jgi:hypothetical protein